MDTPSTLIGPGIGAFVAFFVLAVVLWFLMRNMNGRMRRMAYREQQRVAEVEAAQAAREAQLPEADRRPRKRKRDRTVAGADAGAGAGARDVAGRGPGTLSAPKAGDSAQDETDPNTPTP